MEKHAQMMDSIQAAAGAINGHYTPSLQQLLEKHNISGLIVTRCQLAQSAAPDPLTVAVFTERDPYANPEAIADGLAQVAEAGYLTAVSPGAYLLTDKGTALANEVLDVTKKAGADAAALLPAEINTLVTLLGQVVAAVEDADVPQACLRRSRFFDPGPDAPVAERTRRYLNDLLAFRDDAHMAAWREHEADGHVWEAFSHVWGENVWGEPAQTAAALAEKLAFRGYDADAYAAALDSLVARGWLAETDGEYMVTEKGRALRTAVEQQTDQIFFDPWQTLTADELRTLQQDLEALAAALQAEPA